MITMFNLPKYKKIVYQFNPQNGFYQKSISQPEPFAVNQLPFELKREKTFAEQIKINASEGLFKHEYKKTNHSRTVLTGLQTTEYKNWFCGDCIRFLKTNIPTATNKRTFSTKEKSLLIIHFAKDNSELIIYLFSGYFIDYTALRYDFVNKAIPQLQKGL